MWVGQNKKTHEHQHLSVLRVNKCLYVTLLLLLGLEALSVPCTCHSGYVWRRDSSFTLKCYLVSSIMQTLAKPAKINKEVPEVRILYLHIANITRVFNQLTKAPIKIALAWLVSVWNLHLQKRGTRLSVKTSLLTGPGPVVFRAADRFICSGIIHS